MLTAAKLSLGVFAISALAACAAKTSDSDNLTPQDSTAIAAEAEKWRTTTLARDFDKFATTLASDAVLMPPNLAPLIGQEASMAYIRAYPTITKFDVTVTEMAGRGDFAYDRGDFALTAKLPNGTEINDKGNFFSVFRKQADGSWKHSRVMWHSNLPAPTPPAPPTATKAGTKTR
jgi:ketosteroid isomerase-like protein